METNTKIGYKGYNSDFTCTPTNTPYQYAENTIHELPKGKKLECCETGFHYCPNPLDVLDFYPMLGNNGELNIFTKVEVLGKIDYNGVKRTTDKIRIGKKLSVKEYVDECIKYMKENDSDVRYEEHLVVNVYEENCRRVSIGDYSLINTSEHGSEILTDGYGSQVYTEGEYSRVITNGNNSTISSSGYTSEIISSGDNTKINSNGRFSEIVSSGNNSIIISDGEYADIVAIGNNSTVLTYKEHSNINIQGNGSIAFNLGLGGRTKGAIGTRMTLTEHDEDGNKVVCTKSATIDGKELKENVWYTLKNGEFVEY